MDINAWKDWSEVGRNIALLAGVTGGFVALGVAVQRMRIDRERVSIDRQRLGRDSFAKAVDLLGGNNRATWLGGIYALEQMLRTNPELHEPIVQSLCAFLRQDSREKGAENLPNALDADGDEQLEAAIWVVAALDALSRRPRRNEERPLDLRKLAARKLSYDPSRRLDKADLREADLREASLSEATLAEANLSGANLRNAILIGADLSDADLTGVDLSGADVRDADLQGAGLIGADLQRAKLSGADLHSADLRNAKMSGASFVGADLRMARIHGADLTYADLRQADLRETQIEISRLHKATYDNLTKWPAGFDPAPIDLGENPQDSTEQPG